MLPATEVVDSFWGLLKHFIHYTATEYYGSIIIYHFRKHKKENTLVVREAVQQVLVTPSAWFKGTRKLDGGIKIFVLWLP